MERNGFNPSNFETSGDKSDGSKEKSKTKKKKSAEAIVDTTSASKKEAVADRTKALLDKFFGDGDETEAKKAPTDEKPERADAKKPETDTDLRLEKDTVGATETPAEQVETADEEIVENQAEIEQLTVEEEPQVDQRLIDANIEQLKAEIAATDDEIEVAAAQAAIESLENLPAGELLLETAEMQETGIAPELREALFTDEDEPLPFDDEGDVPLTKPVTTASGSQTPPPLRPVVPSPAAAPSPAGRTPTTRPAAPNVAPANRTEYQPDYRVNPNATYLLVGGVVGYLIGRRRGRIKTEKRMNVVVAKLEKQVEAKQQQIDRHVEAAKQKARAEYWATKDKKPVEAAAPRAFEDLRSDRREPTRPESTTGFHPSGGESTRPEKAAVPERVSGKPERRPETAIELSDADIHRISETITIGATNLRKIHEAKLVTDGGLRRLVNEHLQGKDIRRGLAREFLTKELSYERDPRFRDIVPLEAKGQRPQGGSVADQPSAQPIGLAPTTMAASVPSQATGVRKPIPVKQKRSAVSTGLLTTLSFVALALAAYAVWLGLMR